MRGTWANTTAENNNAKITATAALRIIPLLVLLFYSLRIRF